MSKRMELNAVKVYLEKDDDGEYFLALEMNGLSLLRYHFSKNPMLKSVLDFIGILDDEPEDKERKADVGKNENPDPVRPVPGDAEPGREDT